MTQPNGTRTAAIVLFLTAGAVLLAIGFFVSSRSPGADVGAVPPLRIERPLSGEDVANPVTVRFSTPADLRLTQSGWGTRDLHLHLMVDDRELMPAAADITADSTAFRWRLPRLEPGQRRIYLTWAGRHHGNLAGITDTVTVNVRD